MRYLLFVPFLYGGALFGFVFFAMVPSVTWLSVFRPNVFNPFVIPRWLGWAGAVLGIMLGAFACSVMISQIAGNPGVIFAS